MGVEGTSGLRRSPLHERHLAAGAKFASFGGWSMPLEYAGGGVVAEHTAVREAVGLFDVSHLGKVGVVGAGALAHVNRVLTGDLDRIGPGQAQYTLLCNPDGGVVDDLIAYVTGSDEVLLVPNAANASAVVAALHMGAPEGVEVVDLHDAYAVLALQGPRADEVLAAAGVPVELDYMAFARVRLGDTLVIVCRTGYTGERGYELVVPVAGAEAVWDALVAAGEAYGLRPAGLGARDTLRTEMGYPLHGQDLSPQISPLQARSGWAVGWSKPDFVGADALRAEKKAGPSRLLRGLRAEGRGIPRPGMVVRDAEGAEVGTVTSGTFSPTLRTGIALALLAPTVGEDDTVTVDVRTRREPFRVVKPPFVASHVR
ncbi:glycine cleavage system aminomethyltransferase GcvT [Microlunatus flavus]|uniref:Aminomethyltransferase n=1 Tax=Microlunatus flavus TaxID=1036181 RepID=A0A1H9KLA6_9ACTN|nr:glycine cleavage system aminomethyltransferase GcvT [Microlunatus flavus]SEQ99653.1 aminomethyltransferase [Microlunatus flavus]